MAGILEQLAGLLRSNPGGTQEANPYYIGVLSRELTKQQQIADDAKKKYGVSLPEFSAAPIPGSNLDSPRADYYMRNEARAGYPKSAVTYRHSGTNQLGGTSTTDPTQVSIDNRSHQLLNIPTEWTRVHEGSHQDMLYSGRKDILPFTAFLQKPIGKTGLSSADFMEGKFEGASFHSDEAKFLYVINNVAKKYSFGTRSREFLADLKAYEASQPKGIDIEQTTVWKDILVGMGSAGEKPEVQRAIKQWYLYNNTASPKGSLEKLLQLK